MLRAGCSGVTYAQGVESRVCVQVGVTVRKLASPPFPPGNIPGETDETKPSPT